MASEIDPQRFIAGLRFLLKDLTTRGVRDAWVKRGEDWINAGWQQDDAILPPGDAQGVIDELEGLLMMMERVGIRDVVLIQTNEVTTGNNGRIQFTGQRTMFARWKWDKYEFRLQRS